MYNLEQLHKWDKSINKKDLEIEIREVKTSRSVEISTRFNGWLTWLWKKLKESGVEMVRDEIYIRCLLEACSITAEDATSKTEYPYFILDGALRPLRTSGRTNKEMMTACQGIEIWAYKQGIYQMPERVEKWVDSLSKSNP